MGEHIICVDTKKCIGCGLCQQDCPENNIAVNNKAVIKEQTCMKCGHCVAICPKAAVSITGFDAPSIEIESPAQLNPQQLLDALCTRRSIRQFKDQPVPPEVIAQIIEAGRLTPTAKNAQDLSYVVLTGGIERCEKIAVRLFKRLMPAVKLVNPAAKKVAIDEHFFFKKAPAAILILSKDKVSGSLAASNMALMAEASGLGVLFSGFFTIAANHSKKLRKELHLKHGHKVVTTLVLGCSNVVYHRTAQREAAVVRYM